MEQGEWEAYIKVRLDCRRVSESSFLGTSYEGIVEDLSEQTSLEEQLRQSQKMEAIGRLAGGIAHDFNNLLTIISGYTGILMDTLTEEDPRRDDAERIKNASHRAADLTRQLLAFSRKQVLSPTTLNLNDAIADLLKILPRMVGEDIDLAFVPAKRTSLVYADQSQMGQPADESDCQCARRHAGRWQDHHRTETSEARKSGYSPASRDDTRRICHARRQ